MAQRLRNAVRQPLWPEEVCACQRRSAWMMDAACVA